MTALVDQPVHTQRSRPNTQAVLRSAPASAAGGISDTDAAALAGFLSWFERHHRLGELSMPADGVLDVQPSLSRSFCVGLHDLRYFIGVPKGCMAWFSRMPWRHVEVSASTSCVALRCAAIAGRSQSLPAFALNFNVQPASYTSALVHYHFLDVRAIDPIPAGGGAFNISREVYLTLPIRIATPGQAAPSHGA